MKRSISSICRLEAVSALEFNKMLPVGFKNVGMQTHYYFDKIKGMAKKDYSQKYTQTAIIR